MIHFKKIFVFALLLSISLKAQEEVDIAFLETFKLPGISVRAIEVTEEHTLWFAGSNGRYGRIINEKIEMDSISHQGKYPQFRSIAYNGHHIFLLSIENPALLYKIDPTKPFGETELVYKESDPKVFYDSLAFFDNDKGLAMGDPTEDCLSIIKTSDGGNNWTKMTCDELPKITQGEAAFAASNTNIAINTPRAWIATGGSRARVFYSQDYGKTWATAETPLAQGGKMTGIFTIDFYDNNKGIIMGGNWEDKKNGTASKAISNDGGLTWNLISENALPGYISCVQYLPDGDGNHIMAVSTEGIFYSKDAGLHWNMIKEKGYYSIRFINKETAWLSGHEEITKIKLQ